MCVGVYVVVTVAEEAEQRAHAAQKRQEVMDRRQRAQEDREHRARQRRARWLGAVEDRTRVPRGSGGGHQEVLPDKLLPPPCLKVLSSLLLFCLLLVLCLVPLPLPLVLWCCGVGRRCV